MQTHWGQLLQILSRSNSSRPATSCTLHVTCSTALPRQPRRTCAQQQQSAGHPAQGGQVEGSGAAQALDEEGHKHGALGGIKGRERGGRGGRV